MLMFFATTLLSGCVTDYGHKQRKLASFPLVEKNINFEEEISQIERTLDTMTDEERAIAALDLAILYSHHRNPNPDYMSAYKRMEEYISLVPESEAIDNYRYLASLLKETQKLNRVSEELKKRDKKLKNLKKNNRSKEATIKRIKRENEILIKKQAVLESEYKKLIDETGKLKDLDMRIEQMWRQVH